MLRRIYIYTHLPEDGVSRHHRNASEQITDTYQYTQRGAQVWFHTLNSVLLWYVQSKGCESVKLMFPGRQTFEGFAVYIVKKEIATYCDVCMVLTVLLWPLSCGGNVFRSNTRNESSLARWLADSADFSFRWTLWAINSFRLSQCMRLYVVLKKAEGGGGWWWWWYCSS